MRSPDIAQGSAKKRVLRQFVEALVYEKIITCEVRPLEEENTFSFHFELGQQDYCFVGKLGAFDRVRMFDESLFRIRKDGSRAPVELFSLVMALPVDEDRKDQLIHELEQTIQLCDWNRGNLRERELPRHLMDYAALESALDEGHLYHPCFKARTGFSLEDHQRYGPECAQVFQLAWLAVRRDSLRAALPVAEEIFWQRELDKESWLLLNHRLRKLGSDLIQFSLMPIHPWQWSALKNQELQPLIDSGNILYLGCAGDYYQATQSVRSLLNASHPEKATIKLPLNMVNTSSLRVFDAHAVCSAPAISSWLKTVVQADRAFNERYPLILLEEYAALLYEPEQRVSSALEGQVGVIWRESLYPYLHPNERAVPFTALALTENDGQPFIENWCLTHGLEAWLSQLLRVVILPVWHLLVKHGIALEAHAQNMILIHQNGWPVRIALRDFHESVEYVDEFLASHEFLPDFISLNDLYKNAPPDRYYWMNSVEALRELVMDTLFVFNLAEISCLIERHYQFSEKSFWQNVSHLLSDYLIDNPDETHRQAQLGYREKRINAESLVTRKLSGARNFLDQNYLDFHHSVTNPLASSDEALIVIAKSEIEYDLCE